MNETRLVVCVNQRLGIGQKSCAGSGSRKLIDLLRKNFKENSLDVAVVEQVCLGRCEEGVVMRIAPGGQFFTQVTADDIDEIAQAVMRLQK